jgi:hypothetical protein
MNKVIFEIVDRLNELRHLKDNKETKGTPAELTIPARIQELESILKYLKEQGE